MCVDQDASSPISEGTLQVHRNHWVRRSEVSVDRKKLNSIAGTALLSELADRIGLTRTMSEAMGSCRISRNTHDPDVRPRWERRSRKGRQRQRADQAGLRRRGRRQPLPPYHGVEFESSEGDRYGDSAERFRSFSHTLRPPRSGSNRRTGASWTTPFQGLCDPNERSRPSCHDMAQLSHSRELKSSSNNDLRTLQHTPRGPRRGKIRSVRRCVARAIAQGSIYLSEPLHASKALRTA
jgi:hypothetical protein